jgi:hypothetical protein
MNEAKKEGARARLVRRIRLLTREDRYSDLPHKGSPGLENFTAHWWQIGTARNSRVGDGYEETRFCAASVVYPNCLHGSAGRVIASIALTWLGRHEGEGC